MKLTLKFLAGALLAAFCAAPSPADDFSPARAPSVQVAPVMPVTVTRGKSGKVEIDFRVARGFHINSNQPKSDLLKPTVFQFDPPSDIVISKLRYPAGQDLTFEFLPDEKLNVYAGDVAVTGTVSTTRTIAPGTYRVRGTLRYQACDNRQCYSPKAVPIEFDVKVRKRAGTHGRRNPGQSPHIHQ